MTQTIQNSTDYCRDLIMREDAGRYFASLFAPRAHRPAIWALLAFNQEIAKTREVVTNTTIGLMRLQWWRDAIEKMARGEKVPGNPVAEALYDAMATYQLPCDLFDTLIYAREFDLEDVLPANLQGLEHYADYTTMSLLMLIVRVCGGVVDPERVRYLAVACALVGLVRAIPYHARQSRCYLPQDLMEAAGVRTDQLFSLKPVPALAPVVHEVLVCAEAYLTRATDLGGVRMLAALRADAELYLAQLRAAGEDVFNPVLARPPAFRELRVAFAVLLRR